MRYSLPQHDKHDQARMRVTKNVEIKNAAQIYGSVVQPDLILSMRLASRGKSVGTESNTAFTESERAS